MARPTNGEDVFRAIAHPVRRKLLEMLRDRSLTTGELAKPFNMSQPTISEHLRTLRDAGLITFKPRSNQHLYSVNKSGLRPLQAWMATLK